MAEPNEISRLLAETYGGDPRATYRDPLAAYSNAPAADGIVYDTSNVLNRMRKPNPLTDVLRFLADRIPTDERESNRRGPDEPFANWWARTNMDSGALTALGAMAKGGLGSIANWLDGRPEVGPDTLAPLGLAAFGSAPMGALASNAVRRGGPETMRAYRGVNIGDQFGPHPLTGDGMVWAVDHPGVAGEFAFSGPKTSQTSPAIYPVDLDFKNPKTIDARRQAEHLDDWASDARAAGHDGLIIRRVRDTPDLRGDAPVRTVYAALQPNTVRSAMTGDQLFADSSRASLPGTIVNGMEQASKDLPELLAREYGGPQMSAANPLEKVPPAKPQEFQSALRSKDIPVSDNISLRWNEQQKWLDIIEDKMVIGRTFVTNVDRKLDADPKGRDFLLGPLLSSSWRRRGIGSAVYDALEAFGRQHGMRLVQGGMQSKEAKGLWAKRRTRDAPPEGEP